MTRALAIALVAGCGTLQGIDGPVPPVVTFSIDLTTAHFDPQQYQNPRLALVWGMQWLPEPLCILPPESPQAESAIIAGCRDPFGFVPLRVETSVAADATSLVISLYDVPASDVLVGDITARVAYGNFILFDDLDADGTLDLARPNRLGVPSTGSGSEGQPTMLTDHVITSSFVSMTFPDQRVAYREGAFDETAAFYPRAGCGDPPPAFSIDAASGFTQDAAIASVIAGTLPQETDPSQCVQGAPATTTVAMPIDYAAHGEVACTENNADSSVRYREPTTDAPDFTDRVTACVHLPTFEGPPSPTYELVVSGASTDSCVGLTHYILTGCRTDPNCLCPDWDLAATPPSWWPCPTP